MAKWLIDILIVAVVVVVEVVASPAEDHGVLYKKVTDPDPYGGPGQKKQGRERKYKARKSPKWKPRTSPKPPKHHTPGRDHQKFPQKR